MTFHAPAGKTTDAVKSTALAISNIVIIGSVLTLSLLDPRDSVPDLHELTRFELRRVLTTRDASVAMRKLGEDDAVIAREITVEPGYALSTTPSLIYSIAKWIVKTYTSEELDEWLETIFTSAIATDPGARVAVRASMNRFNPSCPRGVEALERVIVQLDNVLDIEPDANVNVVIGMYCDVMNILVEAGRRSSN